MQGTVRTLIEVLPAGTLSFRGRAERLEPKTIELVGGPFPFGITHTQSNLEGRVAHELETVEAGRKYRLKVSNLAKEGEYSGAIWLHTDLPQKPYVAIRITGAVEGEVSVNPKTLFIGKMAAQKPARSGSVVVSGNSGKPFKITRLDHDEKLITVTQHPIEGQNGYRLEITPQLEDLPPGARVQTLLTVETDLAPGDKKEVMIQLLNTR